MLDSTPDFTENPQISVLARIPKCFSHRIELYRAKNGPIPAVDARAREIAAGWRAEIVGVMRFTIADEIVHTYFAVNHRRRRKSSASAA